jgi:anti-sigma B factor antagonist
MDTFKVDIRENEDITSFDLAGTLDAHTIHILEEAFSKSLQQNKNKFIVNLKKLEYITSAGLGVFMEFIEEIREQGGDIVFCEFSERLYQIFDLLGFPYIYKFFQEEKQARDYLNGLQ